MLPDQFRRVSPAAAEKSDNDIFKGTFLPAYAKILLYVDNIDRVPYNMDNVNVIDILYFAVIRNDGRGLRAKQFGMRHNILWQ